MKCQMWHFLGRHEVLHAVGAMPQASMTVGMHVLPNMSNLHDLHVAFARMKPFLTPYKLLHVSNTCLRCSRVHVDTTVCSLLSAI